MSDRYRKNPHYVEQVRLLIDLHSLMKAGQGDSLDAELARNRMDSHWGGISDAEIERIEGLSADLYTLETNSPINHPQSVSETDHVFWERLSRLKAEKDFDSVLALLRGEPQSIGVAHAAFLRGRAYEELGEYEAAVLFLEESVIQDPSNESYAVMLLIRLQKMDRDDKAAFWAREFAARFDNPSPSLLVLLADRFRSESRSANTIIAPHLLRESANLLQRAIARLKGEHSDRSLQLLLVNALLEQSLCLDLLGESEAALDSVNQAIAISPFVDDLALSTRGMLTYSHQPGLAVSDFSQAVKLGTRVVWPYYGLAHHAMTMNDFHTALDYAKAGLQLTRDPETLAPLWEILAISIAETTGQTPAAERAFQNAIALSPENLRIRDNFRLFRESRTKKTSDLGLIWLRNTAFPTTNDIRRFELVSN